jgi:hypothetical protein
MSDPAFADNPWSAEHWNLTRQGQYIKKYGMEVAKTKARQAGATIGGPRPNVVGATGQFMPLPRNRNFTVIIQRKGSNVTAGGGGLVGAGSSGSGAPTG